VSLKTRPEALIKLTDISSNKSKFSFFYLYKSYFNNTSKLKFLVPFLVVSENKHEYSSLYKKRSNKKYLFPFVSTCMVAFNNSERVNNIPRFETFFNSIQCLWEALHYNYSTLNPCSKGTRNIQCYKDANCKIRLSLSLSLNTPYFWYSRYSTRILLSTLLTLTIMP
jgi:hypothetical protein